MAVRARNGESAGSETSILLLIGVALVTVVALVVRAAFLRQPMRQDEADTVVLFALTPLRHILVDTSIPNNHIMHSILVKGSIGVLGLGAAAARTPAFLAGLAIVPLTWLAGRTLYSSRAGLVAAALVAVSTPMVLYSTNARGYSLIAVAMLVALLALRRAIDHGGLRAWALFACALAFGASVNPSMLYPAGGLVMWGVMELFARFPIDRPRLRAFFLACCAAGAMTVVAYLPAIKVSGWRSIVANDYVKPLAWGAFVARLPEFARDFASYLGAGWPVVLQVLVGVAVVVGWVLHRRSARDRWPMSLIVLAWALVLLVAMRRPPFMRVWLFLVPLLAISAGVAVEAVVARIRVGSRDLWAGVFCLLLVVAAGLSLVRQRATDLLTETGVFPHGKAVADALARQLAPGDLVAAQWRAQGPVDFYLREQAVQARFANRGDTVTGRLFVIPAAELDETPGSVVAFRRLVGVDTTRIQVVAGFPTAALWMIPAPGARP